MSGQRTGGTGTIRLLACPDDGRSCNPLFDFTSTPSSGQCQTHGTTLFPEDPQDEDY